MTLSLIGALLNIPGSGMVFFRQVKLTCYSGLISYVMGVGTIGAAVAVNPWFNVWTDALSDMGRVGLSTAWVFNTGLMTAAIVGMLYVVCLLKVFKGSLAHLAAGVYLVAVGNLFLVGMFPEGTKPHWTVSYEFFFLMLFTYLLNAPALWLEGLRKHALVNSVLFALGLGGSIVISWPSVATLELYNIALMGAWYITMFSAVRAVVRSSSATCQRVLN